MQTLICAGGSGARVLEAVLHLCAAGLGPAKLRMFLIDPDATNGSVKKTRELVDRYLALQQGYAGGPFFKTELELLQDPANRPELQVWSPVRGAQKFRSVLNYEALTPEQKEVLDLFFTEEELGMPMGVGFRGRPALGAAALALLPLYQNDPEERFWARFRGELAHDVNAGETRVMLVGSIFGGTGASTIHPLLRYLRSDAVLETNRQRLKIGAVALVPYFQFNSGAGAPKPADAANREAGGARSELFPLASRSAAEYYEHLRHTDDWDFDAMYWIGDDQPARVQYSIGGPGQNNPAHFVDLLGALASLDFFTECPAGKSCWYAGPEADPQQTGANRLRWEDLPMRQALSGMKRNEVKRALHVLQTAAVAHLGFFEPLLRDSRLQQTPSYAPWYKDRLSGKENLSAREETEQLGRLTTYLRENYFPWWTQIQSGAPGRVQLLNEAAWRESGVSVDRLNNLLHPDQPGSSVDGVDALFSEMTQAAKTTDRKKNLSTCYLQMLQNAATVLVKRQEAHATKS